MSVFSTIRVETRLMLNGDTHWEIQLKDLKETFKEFYLNKFEIIEKGEFSYNLFVFTHDVLINGNHS